MTIKIEIELSPDRGHMPSQLEDAMQALGFRRHGFSEPQEVRVKDGLSEQVLDRAIADVIRQEAEERAEAAAEEKPKRGKPGRTRRPKEDDADKDDADKDDATPEQVAREFANISSGDERISPEDVQDADDEAAETEKAGLAPIDELRRLIGAYQKKHGMAAAVALCEEGGLVGKGMDKLDDAELQTAIAAMRKATAGEASPADEKAPVELEPVEEEKPATKQDLVEAMLRYAERFDGTRDQAKMTHTLVDCPKIFTDLFGPDVTKVSQVPEDGYGRAIAAIDDAIKNDPFGRA